MLKFPLPEKRCKRQQVKERWSKEKRCVWERNDLPIYQSIMYLTIERHLNVMK